MHIGGSVVHDARKAGALKFVTNSAHERAAHYREHTAKLRKMAETEPGRRLRNNLLSLADQYEFGGQRGREASRLNHRRNPSRSPAHALFSRPYAEARRKANRRLGER
jgi:hypothetical protein